ncbi:L,D-transpeptidase/peptidoglycan binding protein [Clostridium tagluense]|uniref:L,D-transpeptidase family protein n=1 Tax=Clostridium tagluense TaxID=360422 RepID=UPI001CF5BDB3|nr:peptidoglycan binding domain-containing protein [Clostridium tagluense]MCB2312291.1 L,D-transpeptidase/peptidoglycan binding protein [Clostridium tagluense]MCB2316971.1 L,D-transpeptidase/peptidoglycan binding protein [Clostridium tagluense]MCB2321830.1 L,D-transpeptidase/peptidoglycan binding protein [Clostridium tagluense]MCB2331563.1 L,D-transpeptidase/peptidoglycan binding protein [Clostridium tagluense]MCB2336322.1 L,D-transpeptidase/peptidoglycan binding protein [Clostridium tagluense
MKNVDIKKLFTSKGTGNVIIFIASILLIYLIISLYFSKHFFFNTVINGVDVSLKAHEDTEDTIRGYVINYKLQLAERNGEIEEIIGRDIGMEYNEKNSIDKVYPGRNSFKWIISLLKDQKYYVEDLFIYNKDNLKNKINGLNCLTTDIIEPQNVSFKYINGSYKVIEEVYGNKIIKDKLYEDIEMGILKGVRKLDLNETLCYENPRYTLSSYKALVTKNLLNEYVKAKITYKFGNEKEILDGNIINEWLSIDKNLETVISKIAVMKYVKKLSKKYDTVGIARKFKTSMGKIVEVSGGLYGWEINREAEAEALLENIKLGNVFEKEPIYAQKALYRAENEIGNTYVEVNITRQHLWFYKNGELITQGSIVTGNPNRGHSTVLGTYMLNYKQKGATLTGPGYEAPVTYWMPFFGNIGIHDASWRYSFGGAIYKRRGSHGCINAPIYLAKEIFENIEEGTPIICYEE